MDRPYRKALSYDEAFRRLREGAGSQFDPEIVAAFLRVRDEYARTVAEQPAERGRR